MTTYNLDLHEADDDTRDLETLRAASCILARLTTQDPQVMAAALRAAADRIDPRGPDPDVDGPASLLTGSPAALAELMHRLTPAQPYVAREDGGTGSLDQLPQPVHACREKRGALIIGEGDTARCGCTPCPVCGIVPVRELCGCVRPWDTADWTVEMLRERYGPPLPGEMEIVTSRGAALRISRTPHTDRPAVKIVVFGAGRARMRLRLTDDEAGRLGEAIRQAAHPID